MIYSKDDVKRMFDKVREQIADQRRNFVKCPSCNALAIVTEEIEIVIKDIENTL